MMKTTSRSITARNVRRRLLAKKIGKFESLEQRQVMANDFLAGTAFIDSNNNGQLDTNENYLQGATIELRSADGSTLLNTQVTDAKGGYLFANVSPGDYRLVNRSAANYAGSATQSLTELNTINGSTANSINVTLRSPTDLGASVDMDRFVNVIGVYEEVTVAIGGYSATTKIGQLPAKAHGSTLNPNPGPEFWTLSVDLYNLLGIGVNGPYTVDASATPIGTGSPQNGGRVAYLYNQFGLTARNAVEAAALQLAVWELLYDASSTDPDGDLSSGNFKVLSATADTILTAQSYLTASLNKAEAATFLNVPGQPTSPTVNNSQGIIVGGRYNFANVPAAKIGDLVWHDKNKNGRQESIEPRIPGATVKLYQDTTLIATTTTDNNGFYQFDRLLAGTYKVEFVLPDGFTQFSPANTTSDELDSDGPITGPITLAAGVTNNTIDQGFYKLARLGDFVWNDRNGNGRQTPDEEGIAGAQVKLLQDDVLVETKVTDNNGFYLFENLQPGVYNLEFIKPVGFAFISPQGFEASPLDSDGPFVFDVPLESGQDELRIDQGFYGASTIGDFVWHDLDADGTQDSNEVGIDGVTVELLRDGNVIATTVTTGGGRYSFFADPGTYQVKFTRPAGYTHVSPTDATTDNLDSDGLISAPVTVGTDETITNIDIGFFNLATIGDFVWHDLDADGIQDASEPGIDGLTVSLINGTTEVATTLTANGGKYTFSVIPGSYTIKFTKLANFNEVSPTNATSDDLDSDGVVADGLTTPSVIVISGDTNNTLDQGFYQLVKIGNFVWDDLDADGVQDSNEPGIDGATVDLLQGTTIVATTTTVGGGLYSFGVAPGTYTLKFTKPIGYTKSSPTDATSDDLDSDELSAPLTVLSGATNTTFDQGFYNEATIGNFVWHDLNANGIQEANEPGVNGVSVSLMRGTTEIATALTAGGGFYSFSVEPGTYTVKFTKPSSYSDISPTNAANDEIDSDGLTVPVTVVSGETNNSIDLGLFNVATIGNFVWHDVNANGIQDPTDIGINGVAVSLMRGSTEVASTTTTGGGLYSFVVVPGAYTIKFTLPSGFTDVSPVNATSDDLDSDGPNIDVTVLSGDINNTFDQGFYSLATIGNYVWHDLDADGVQDSNESGIDGVAVSLMRGTTELATTSTAGGGLYSFSVIPGEYTVKFTQPTTYSNVSPTDATSDDLDSDGLTPAPITLLSGATSNTLDLGLFNLATIGNYVWNDADADGIQDSTEVGINGVNVRLMQGSTQVATTTTTGGGLYSFIVAPGTYTVQFTQPAEFNSVSPANATSDDLDSDGLLAPVTVISGEINNAIDQGFFNSVSDVCIAIDLQGNTPISGAHGNVRTFSAGGVSVNASAFSRTTTGIWSPAYLGSFGGGLGVTDSSETGDGATHTVDNIGSLNYVLFEFSQEVLVDAAFLGYVVTDSDLTVWIGNVSNAFTNHQTLSDAFLNGLGFSEANLTTSSTARTADINAGGIRGNILVIAAQVDDTTPEDNFKIANLTVCVPGAPGSASIGDSVWHDINGNGLQESHEPGIHGATVTLVGGGPDKLINGVGDTTTTTTTDSTGKYKFANLTAGTQYRVTFSTPSGYDAATPRKVGTNTTLDSDGLTSDVIVLSSGEFNSSIDAGFIKHVKVGNYVWNDSDMDGLQETGELGIGGVQVTLTGTTGSGASVTHSTTTASNGSYQFTTLQPGTYTVSIPASNFNAGGVLVGYTASPTAVGTDRGLDSNSQPAPTTPATLSSGGSDFSLDFGYYTTMTLACVTMKMEGNTSTSGAAGNTRTFSAGGISVKARAFARDSWGSWSSAFLGSYPGGLGVTDSSEGTGAGTTHTMDNVGRRNYIVFEFSQDVTIDTAFLGYVSVDSDLTAWIGTVPDAFNNPRALSDSYLTALGYSENNDTTLSTSRTANLNAGNRSGNILVVSAATTGTQNDSFKLAELTLCGMIPTNTAGTKFFVVDDNVDRTFKYTSAVQYQNNFAVIPTSPTGVAANPAGTTTWVSDVHGRVFRYNNNGVLHSSWNTGIGGTQGVTTNGTSIWTVSSSADRVYFYSGAASFVPTSSKLNPTLTSSFRLHSSNTNPKDLATDGKTIWVVDDGSFNFIYAYSVSGTYLGRWQLDSANATPTGITIDPSGGSKIWVVDSGTDRIYEYSGATGCRSGGLMAMKTYALNGGNTNPQGIADPPAGDGDNTISEALAASLLVDGSSINSDVNPYYNVLSPSDVNDDGYTTAMDALVIINRLNSGTASELSIDDVASGQRLDLADVNNDGFVSPLDALLVINQLNQLSQGAMPAIEQPHDEPAYDLPLGETSATDEVFGDIGLAAEGEVSAAAFMFEAEMNLQRRRR